MTMLPTSIKLKLCLLICQIFVSTISIEFQAKIDYQKFLINAMVNITKSCQTYHGSSTLAVGKFYSKEMQKLSSEIKPIIIFNNYNLSTNKIIQQTVQLLVISTNSTIEVNKLLLQVKNSSMWNYLRFNIISHKITSRRNCRQAESYLLAAWKNDLLNSIFLCVTPKKIINVYTYNPYTNRAPLPWKFLKNKYNNGNYWNLYMLEYRPGLITCDILFFDKTQQLDGYRGTKIISYIPPKDNVTNIYYNYNTNIKKRFDVSMTNILFNKMNITVSYSCNHEYGAIDDNGNAIGVDKNVANNDYDVLLDHRFLTYTRGLLESTFILGDSGITFISHHRSKIPVLLQIVYYFKPIVILFTLIFLGLTITILKLSIEESFDTAAIEVFRLFFNGPILKVPLTAPPRIYLFTVLLFILIMQTILQSKMLSFIMVPMSRDLNTFAQLENHKNYIVYCKERYKNLISPNLAARAIIVNSYAGLFNDSQVTMIWENSIAISSASQHHMHYAREVISKCPITHLTRKSWPLIKRVNKIYMRLLESGISDFQMKSSIFYTIYNRTDSHDNHDDNENERRVLTLSDLNFAFQILICGLICSFISFLIEIKFWNYFSSFLKCMMEVYYDEISD